MFKNFYTISFKNFKYFSKRIVNKTNNNFDNLSAIKTRNNYKNNNFNNSQNSNPFEKSLTHISEEYQERNKLKRIIDNPDEAIKLNEDDIHSALMKTGKLPELDLKEIINSSNNYNSSNNTYDLNYIYEDIESEILPKLNLCLNKSLVEICKVAKNNPQIFRKFEQFWIKLQEEISMRKDSLANEQIVEILSSYTKCEMTDNINLYEELEESITDSPVKFLISESERIFNAYCHHKKGSTTFLKVMAKRFFRHKDIFNSLKLAKIIQNLNNHPQSIKGNFGLVKELEEEIKSEIENKSIKFRELINLGEIIFSENLCTNDTQLLIENAIEEKFNNKIEIEISYVIKLLKSLNNYYIKNENLCLIIKNYLEVFLNGYINRENEIINDNEDEDNNNSTPKNINLIFNEQYTKLITNLNTIIWSISKNKIFLSLRENDEFKYFYSRLRETFMKNIDYYNSREIVFSLEGLLKIQNEFTHIENEIITNKLKSLEFSTTHDMLKLFKILIKNEDLLNDKLTLDNLIEMILNNHEKLSYQDLIDFVDIFYNFPLNHTQIVNNQKFKNYFENKFTNILLKMDIIYLCKLVNIFSKPIFINIFNDTNLFQNIFKTIQIRINEIPKENFCEILSNMTKLKNTELVTNLIDILEDLSNFENIQIFFNNPIEYLNLLWSLLTIKQSWNLKLNIPQSNFVENTIKKYFNLDKNKNEIFDLFIEDFLVNKFDISLYLNKNLQNKEEIYYKYLQTVYLTFLYMKENLKLDQNESKLFLDKINEKLFEVSIKFDLNMRSNFISLDPASKCNKEIVEDIQKNILEFFQPKPNATIYPNFIDEFLNPVNILVNFELPKMDKDEMVTGIDSKIFGIIILNNFYKNLNGELISTYDNRIRILREVFNFEIKEIEENNWKNLNIDNVDNLEKKKYIENLLGFNFNNDENIKINIINKVTDSKNQLDITGNKRIPKYNLTKKLISK